MAEILLYCDESILPHFYCNAKQGKKQYLTPIIMYIINMKRNGSYSIHADLQRRGSGDGVPSIGPRSSEHDDGRDRGYAGVRGP